MFRMLPRILENVLHRPATRRFPYTTREPFVDARGNITFDMTACKFCGQCATCCPAAAIKVTRPTKELDFEPFKCVACGACVDACKFGCVKMGTKYRSPSGTKPVEENTTPTPVVPAAPKE